MNQEITFFQHGEYRIHVADGALRKKLDKYKRLRCINTYYDKQGICGWDYILPASLHNRVAQMAGLPLKNKNQNRVVAGQRSKVSTGAERYDLTKVNSVPMLKEASIPHQADIDTGRLASVS